MLAVTVPALIEEYFSFVLAEQGSTANSKRNKKLIRCAGSKSQF